MTTKWFAFLAAIATATAAAAPTPVPKVVSPVSKKGGEEPERDYITACGQREWDRLAAWHNHSIERRCYSLGQPQLYPDSVYVKMERECRKFPVYECSFRRSTRLIGDDGAQPDPVPAATFCIRRTAELGEEPDAASKNNQKK